MRSKPQESIPAQIRDAYANAAVDFLPTVIQIAAHAPILADRLKAIDLLARVGLQGRQSIHIECVDALKIAIEAVRNHLELTREQTERISSLVADELEALLIAEIDA